MTLNIFKTIELNYPKSYINQFQLVSSIGLTDDGISSAFDYWCHASNWSWLQLEWHSNYVSLELLSGDNRGLLGIFLWATVFANQATCWLITFASFQSIDQQMYRKANQVCGILLCCLNPRILLNWFWFCQFILLVHPV